MDDVIATELSLMDALVRWGDADLVDAVRKNGEFIPEAVIEESGRPVLVTSVNVV